MGSYPTLAVKPPSATPRHSGVSAVYTLLMLGIPTPRVEFFPQSLPDYSAGDAACELAEACGLNLYAWQRHVLRNACLQRANGTWAAFEVGLVVARQNGKGSILEARELAGLFLFGEKLQLHSSHEFKTTIEAYRRIAGLIENSPAEIRKMVKSMPRSHGDEGIELRNGNRLRFVARTTGSGRGFSVDTVYWDEAYNLGSEAKAALLPTLSSRPNPQLWYTSSAGWEISTALNDVRIRAEKKDPEDKRLYYAEWSVDPEDYDVNSVEDWARANPSMGMSIGPSEDFIRGELAAMRNDLPMFARERLGVGQWPASLGGWSVIPEGMWRDCGTRGKAEPGMILAIDCTPELSWSSVAAAGTLEGTKKTIIDLVDHRPGTDWVIPRVIKLVSDRSNRIRGVVVAPRGPAGSLLNKLERALEQIGKGHILMKASGADEEQACGAFYDGIMKDDSIRHLNQEDLDNAISGVSTKEQTEGLFKWVRRSLAVDISPLYAVTLALWGHQKLPARRKPFIASSGG